MARVKKLFLPLLFLASLPVSLALSAQPALEPILLGYPSPALTELPNYLAVKKNFYAEEGLDIKFVRARSNILVAALVSGSLDYITSITSSIGGIIGGAPVKIVAGGVKNKPDFFIGRSEVGLDSRAQRQEGRGERLWRCFAPTNADRSPQRRT